MTFGALSAGVKKSRFFNVFRIFPKSAIQGPAAVSTQAFEIWSKPSPPPGLARTLATGASSTPPVKDASTAGARLGKLQCGAETAAGPRIALFGEKN